MKLTRTVNGTAVVLTQDLGCGLWLCEVVKGGYTAAVHEDDLAKPTT
jgi:hypothetical protein